MPLPVHRFFTCLLTLCFCISNVQAPATSPVLPSLNLPSQALGLPTTFFARFGSAPRCAILRQAATWLRGDDALRELRASYRRPLRYCFALMAGDAAASLAVPFIGQALYDAAAQGASPPGSLRTMIAVSSLLLIIEGLDPLRRYAQFRLAAISSAFVADVRVHLLGQALADKSSRWDPARPGLIYFHGPSFAIRNIELPLKLPLIAGQGILSGWLLWERDPVVVGVACLTAGLLFIWSHWRSRPLAEASQELRQAESETLAALERIAVGPTPEQLRQAEELLERVCRMEIQQTRQGVWYEGVVDRVSTVILMTGVMLWGTWHQYWTGSPSTGQILTLLALAWNVQYRISALLGLAKRRLEAESATFLIPKKGSDS
jgi:hypothetical protein